MKVRKASGGDVPRIAEIHVRSWRAAYRGILPDELLDDLKVSEREESWRALLSDGGDRWLTLVAEGSGRDLTGFCSVATPSRDEVVGFVVEEGIEKREERSGRPVIRLRAVVAD